MRHKKSSRRRSERQEEAIERQEEYDALSVEERIAKLDRELGKGKGAKKERARLANTKTKKKKVEDKKESV